MKTLFVFLALMVALSAAIPASACVNRMTGASAAPSGGGLLVSWTYQNECGGTCLFKLETQCCDGGSWRTLVDNYEGTSYTYTPATECETGWRFRVTMVQGCNWFICYTETGCY
jgi:hypothetical protein